MKRLSELELAQLNRKHKNKLKRDTLYAKLGMETEDQYRERRQMEQDKQYASIPKEQKQKFLDLFMSGKMLGEAAQEAGIDSDMASQVILRNAKNTFPSRVEE